MLKFTLEFNTIYVTNKIICGFKNYEPKNAKYIVFKSYFLIAMNGKLTSTCAKSIGADCSKMSCRS